MAWRRRAPQLSTCFWTSTARCLSWTPRAATGFRFVVTRVPVSPEKPHGPDGDRLVGFDNARPVARQKRGESQDHRHRLRTIKAYDYRDAVTLLSDFWTMVDAVLREREVIP